MPRLTRRDFLALSAAGPLAAHRTLSPRASLRFAAVGQALILRDLATQDRAGFDQMREFLGRSDVAFTNLEVAIRGPRAQNATPLGAGVNAAPVVLDSLRRLSFNLLSLSNNHAADLGETGLLSTIEETTRRGFATAGTGRTLAEAAQPAYLTVTPGKVALIAMASSAVRPDAIATASRAGVNHVAQRGGVVDPTDSARVLNAIREAASQADWVVVYQHDHYWAPDWQQTPEWKKAWCRSCIDAGASVFVSHGVPILHGIEIYQQRPIFYGLGNFVFHASIEFQGNVPAQYTSPSVFQSVVADCEFDGGRLTSMWLSPITLKSEAGVGEGNYKLHGNPRLATGTEAQEILTRLTSLSKAVGTDIEIVGTRARLRLG
jgi:poly-gamma-glutamate synthesis protein (capsule biosynthesis protein)